MKSEELVAMLEKRHMIKIIETDSLRSYSLMEIISILEKKQFKIIKINCKEIKKTKELIEKIYSSGENYTPGIYGYNWNALEDILVVGEPHFNGPTVIVLSEYENLLSKENCLNYKIFMDLLLDLIMKNDNYYIIITSRFSF